MGDDSRSNDELLEAAGNGDEGALALLFERHRERLERMVRLRMDRRLQGRVDPADVVQEAYGCCAQPWRPISGMRTPDFRFPNRGEKHEESPPPGHTGPPKAIYLRPGSRAACGSEDQRHGQ
jgi:hypothetical protein